MSTGPTGGSGGTTGPGHLMRSLMEHLRVSRARSAAAAQQAGSRGSSPEPLGDRERIENYRQQTGRSLKRMHRRPSSKWWWLRDDLTPKQRRRAEHKANRATRRRLAV